MIIRVFGHADKKGGYDRSGAIVYGPESDQNFPLQFAFDDWHSRPRAVVVGC